MNFIKKHKNVFIVLLACMILMILAFFAVYKMFYPNSHKSVYGSRVEEAPKIDSVMIEKIKDDIMDKDIVANVSYKLNGATMKFFIDTKNDTKVKDAQNLTIIITDNLTKSITDFYDIQVYILQSENKEAKEFPMIGYRSKNAQEFTFVVNKVGEDYEK